MRIVTWNCSRGPFATKVPLLDALAPDIAVIQECERPSPDIDNCLWFGDNPKIGLAIKGAGPYRVEAMPALVDVPKYVIPISVSGPSNFTLFAVWSISQKPYPYVEAIVRAVDLYRHQIDGSRTVIVGDFNSNARWDKDHPNHLNHSALVTRLAALGLVSAYHATRPSEPHGSEELPTYYHQWNEAKPFHIDYCFVPEAWVDRIQRVEIGSFAGWSKYSDHRPLLVEVNEFGMAADTFVLDATNRDPVAKAHLQKIVGHFHQLVRARSIALAPDAVAPIGMPDLQAVEQTTQSGGGWFPVPAMYGGFAYQLDDADSSRPRLAVSSWSRVIAGSGQRHEVTANGHRLVGENDDDISFAAPD